MDRAPRARGLPGLTSNGETVAYDVNGTTGVLTAYVDDAGGANAGVLGAGDRLIFTLELESNGDYTFTLLDQIDHAAPTAGADENIETLDLSSAIVATDADDDSIVLDNGFTIRVFDDIPVNNDATESGDVDEDALTPGANADSGRTGEADGGELAVATGSVAGLVDDGADAPASFSLNGVTGGLPGLTSNGETVAYDVDASTGVLTGSRDAPAPGIARTRTWGKPIPEAQLRPTF